MALKEKLDALNGRLQKILKPGVDEVLEQHMTSLRTDGFLNGVLKPGTAAPSFTLINQHGDRISSAALLATGPLVVCFTRGGWCPFCVEEANAYNELYDRFQDVGARLVLLTPQAVDGIKEWAQKTPYRFDLLRDAGNQVGEAYGVVYTFPDDLRHLYETAFAKNIPAINDAEGWKLPVPAQFIVDQGGHVRYSEADPNYRVRPEPADTLALLQELSASAR